MPRHDTGDGGGVVVWEDVQKFPVSKRQIHKQDGTDSTTSYTFDFRKTLASIYIAATDLTATEIEKLIDETTVSQGTKDQRLSQRTTILTTTRPSTYIYLVKVKGKTTGLDHRDYQWHLSSANLTHQKREKGQPPSGKVTMPKPKPKPTAKADQTPRSSGEDTGAFNVPVPKPVSERAIMAAESLDEQVGVEKIAKILGQNIIFPQRLPTLFPNKVTAILMYGPPGTGKSYLAKGLVKSLREAIYNDPRNTDIQFFVATGATLKGSFIGETEKNITALYMESERLALATQNPAAFNVLFIDEIDSIVPSRSSDSAGSAGDAVGVTTMLQVMDGAVRYDHSLTLAATNLPWALDSAILSRFALKLFVDLPGDNARRERMEAIVRKRLNLTTAIIPEEIAGILDYLVDCTGFSATAAEKTAAFYKGNGITGLKSTAHYWAQHFEDMGHTASDIGRSTFGYSFRDLNALLSNWMNSAAHKKASLPTGTWSTKNKEQAQLILQLGDCCLIPTKNCRVCIGNMSAARSVALLVEDVIDSDFDTLLADNTSSVINAEYVEMIYYNLEGERPSHKQQQRRE